VAGEAGFEVCARRVGVTGRGRTDTGCRRGVGGGLSRCPPIDRGLSVYVCTRAVRAFSDGLRAEDGWRQCWLLCCPTGPAGMANTFLITKPSIPSAVAGFGEYC